MKFVASLECTNEEELCNVWADNIVRDAGHITYTCFSNVFVSEDAGTLKKAKFINKLYNLGSIVCNETEFLKLEFYKKEYVLREQIFTLFLDLIISFML